MILSDGNARDFAPQALGETTPSLSNGYFYAETGLSLSGRFATYAALYRAQPSVATVVDKIANSAARLTLKVWDSTPKTGKVEDAASGYANLLARPTTFMSTYNFWRWTFATYEVFGEAFWLKQRDSRGNVIGLLPMHPSRTMVKRDEDGNTFYVFTIGVASAGLLTAPASDVVPFQRYNPDSLMRGMSRLEPLRSTLLNEDSSRRATASWWQSGARPSVILKHPGELSDVAQKRIQAGWNSAYAGADNMGKAAVIEEGMDAQVVQLTADEMQYIESRKMNLTEVCMVFDVPPPVVHILDHATFSNITEQMRSMYRDTMAPRLEDIESVIDFHLRPEFFPQSTHAARFSLDEVLRGDFETRATAVGNLIEKGVMKPSEARPMFDLPDAGQVADQLYGNAALVPLGSSVHGMTEVDPAGNLIPAIAPQSQPHAPKEPLPKNFSVRSVMGRMGSVKAAGGDVRQALVDEHKSALEDYYGRLGDALTSAATKALSFDEWDSQLADLLTSLGVATVKALGDRVAKHLGGNWDQAGVADWVAADAQKSAHLMNAKTADNFDASVLSADDPAAASITFRDALIASAAIVAKTRVTVVGGLAEQSAAEQSGAATKTWITGPNPRPAHARMNGETVPLGEAFSNGMNGPGDSSAGSVDDLAGCNCSLEFEMP